MDTQAYLSRIHLQQAGPPDLATLTRLQRSHMQAVPFENFDVVGKREIRLEGAHLYHKVVVERRGGFCYELNGAFGELLGSLGFHVRRVSARVYNAQRVPGPGI